MVLRSPAFAAGATSPPRGMECGRTYVHQERPATRRAIATYQSTPAYVLCIPFVYGTTNQAFTVIRRVNSRSARGIPRRAEFPAVRRRGSAAAAERRWQRVGESEALPAVPRSPPPARRRGTGAGAGQSEPVRRALRSAPLHRRCGCPAGASACAARSLGGGTASAWGMAPRAGCGRPGRAQEHRRRRARRRAPRRHDGLQDPRPD